MTPAPVDPAWPRLLGLSVHEFRTPLSVVAGYIRMLLQDRAGPVTDAQRRLLDQAEKSCARLSGLLGEMSDLANLEAGTATLNRMPVDLHPLLVDVVAALPRLPDQDVRVRLSTGEDPATIRGDAVRLKAALRSVLVALRRELVTTTDLFVRVRPDTLDDRPASRLTVGDADRVGPLEASPHHDLAPFDEWRGGCGLALAVARRIITEHGGTIWSPADGARAGAVVVLPHA